MYLAPVASHLLAVLTACVEICYLICTKYIVHVLGELCFKWTHYSKLLTYKNLGEEFLSTSENHSLLLEVLDVSSLGGQRDRYV